jgi:exosortase
MGLSSWTLATLVLPLLALSPLLYIQASVLMQKPHLQFFPLAILGAAYFLRADAEPSREHLPRPWLIPLWVVAILLCMAALILISPWLAQFCFIVIVAVWAFGARPNLSVLRVTGISGLIAVTLPPPFGWDHQLVQALQAISSFVCSRLMDLTGILHVRRGNIIEIAAKPLFIEEACSGVDSQYALMAVAGVLLLLGRAGLIVSLITIVTVPIWAILGNLLRIYLIVIGLDWFGIDLSSGTVHMFLGLCVFAFTAWVHWSSVQFLNFLQLRYIHSKREHRVSEGVKHPSDGTWSEASRIRVSWVWFAMPLLLFILMPASLQAVFDFQMAPDLPSLSSDVAERFPDRGSLSSNRAQIVGFHSIARDRADLLGQHSRIWQVRNDFSRITVSLDFPFSGWHPLWVCYMNAGWKPRSTEVVNASNDDILSGGFPFYELILENDVGDIAVLHFSLFDEQGQPYLDLAQGSTEPSQDGNRLSQNLWTRIRRKDRVREPLTFQFQQLSTTNTVPSSEQMKELRSLYENFRRQVYRGSLPIIESLRQR